MAYKINNTRVFTRVSQDQATVDLAAFDAAPTKVDLTGETSVQICVYISAAFYWTLADTDANALTRIGSDATRTKWPAGFYQFDCSGNADMSLYLRAQTGAAVTDAISYVAVEGD